MTVTPANMTPAEVAACQNDSCQSDRKSPYTCHNGRAVYYPRVGSHGVTKTTRHSAKAPVLGSPLPCHFGSVQKLVNWRLRMSRILHVKMAACQYDSPSPLYLSKWQPKVHATSENSGVSSMARSLGAGSVTIIIFVILVWWYAVRYL